MTDYEYPEYPPNPPEMSVVRSAYKWVTARPKIVLLVLSAGIVYLEASGYDKTALGQAIEVVLKGAGLALGIS